MALSGSTLLYQNEVMGTNNGKHLIQSNSIEVDSKITNENIFTVYKGGKNSLRIGNITTGGSFERAKTSFKVTAANTLFQYHFAVILQEDNGTRHTIYQKPGFSVKITDASGTVINCGDFDVQLKGFSQSGFKTQRDLEYRNWTTGALDLKNHIGKILNVIVTVHGCTGRRHMG